MKENKEFIQRFADVKADDNRTISGTAILFDVESQILTDKNGTYTEVIKRGAISQELLDNCDIILTYNHEEKQAVPLARSNKGKGSLKLRLTDNGVDFSCRMKNTVTSNEIYEAVKQGDLSGCSFKFYVDNSEGSHKFVRQSDGSYIHEVYKISAIRDISIVTVPAYEETSVYARQLEEIIKTDEAEIVKAKEKQDAIDKQKQLDEQQVLELQRKKDLEFKNYYTLLKKKYL